VAGRKSTSVQTAPGKVFGTVFLDTTGKTVPQEAAVTLCNFRWHWRALITNPKSEIRNPKIEIRMKTADAWERCLRSGSGKWPFWQTGNSGERRAEARAGKGQRQIFAVKAAQPKSSNLDSKVLVASTRYSRGSVT
jgi:hypothetical protein